MEAEIGRFAAFYGSFVQHPLLLWLAAGGAIAFCHTRRGLSPDVRRFCTALGLLSLCDAWLTAPHVVGMGSLPSALATVAPLCFVLLGDFRFFLLLTTATVDGRIAFAPKAIAVAIAWTLLVPLATQAALTASPLLREDPRIMFLIYEVLFACLALGLIRWHARLRANAWPARVSWFVVTYYTLWAAADAVILGFGSDVGFLLRVVPNLLYYGGLIAVIGALSPRVEGAA